MNVTDLPVLNALLNMVSLGFLISGYIFIKRGAREKHKRMMISALITSGLFLTSYLVYHGIVGSVPYPRHDWTRPLYFLILVPHIILAALMGPFIIAAVILALKEKFIWHVRLVKWVWPVWIFVSGSGVMVFLMLYVY